MSSPFDAAYDAHAAPQLGEYFGVRIRLARKSDGGTDYSAALTCSWSKRGEEIDQEQEARGVELERRDWWPLAAAITISDVQTLPRVGDVLQVLDSDDNPTGEQHTVRPDSDEPPVDRLPGGNYLVLRTVRTQTG